MAKLPRLLFALALLPLIFAAVYFARVNTRSPQLDDFGELPDFHLKESSGDYIDLARLRGHVWIANFMFTSCPAQCPMVTAKLKRLQDRLKDEANLRLVSFTVDPERDTPEVLAAYAERHGADRQKWFFVTGAQRDLNALSLNGFRLGDGGAPTAHSFKLVLVDSAARVRGYYDGLDDRQVDSLAEDTRFLLHQRADGNQLSR